MMPVDKKAAIAAYKERKTVAGIYAIRCTATGEVWVGASRHLGTQQNGIWFALRMGSSRNRQLQSAWQTYGEAAFTFEPVEQLPEETAVYLQQALLKERAAFWKQQLHAQSA
ncbi:MAG TPA: GIY-YIG nuclease family protein [Microvirga sp.]|jgi:hypothetical protein